MFVSSSCEPKKDRSLAAKILAVVGISPSFRNEQAGMDWRLTNAEVVRNHGGGPDGVLRMKYVCTVQ